MQLVVVIWGIRKACFQYTEEGTAPAHKVAHVAGARHLQELSAYVREARASNLSAYSLQPFTWTHACRCWGCADAADGQVQGIQLLAQSSCAPSAGTWNTLGGILHTLPSHFSAVCVLVLDLMHHARLASSLNAQTLHVCADDLA